MAGRLFKKIDTQLLSVVILLVFFGFVAFVSASLGLLARSGAPAFQTVAMTQIGLGIGVGAVLMLLISKVNYRLYKQYAIPIFILAFILTALVFVPGLGVHIGGASRWISVAGVSIQPAEILKIATIIFAAWYLSVNFRKIRHVQYGLLPVIALLGAVGILLLLQPDTGTFAVLAAAVLCMFFAAGARFRDLAVLVLIGVIGIGVLAIARPYVLERFTTFLHPWEDQQASGYQIKQSLIAVGSGGVVGRGLGQGVQKFNYLPEPTSDSIFAVIGEEFGFLGAMVIVLLFTWFAQRSFRIAVRAPDQFGALLVVGLSLLVVLQAILNIFAMLALAPLSGLPLPFISHGGTAMAVMLVSVGIILSVSRSAKV